MKKKIAVAAALMSVSFLGASSPATAQDQAAATYIYATYFNCDVTRQKRADEIVDQLDAPVMEAAVKDGTLSGWGWMVHHTGGTWRRVEIMRAPSMEALLAGEQKVNDQYDAKDKGGKLGDEFGRICNSHEDYIWRTKAGNEAAGVRGKMGFSTYFVCDATREDQADAIVTQALAPVYNKLVAEGQLVSWGWLEHIVGGQYRRLATMTAADLPTLMKARASVTQSMQDNPLGDALTGICGSHTDYIWEIKH